MRPTVTIDASHGLARFSRSGIPEQVRRNLRRLLPDLTKRLGAAVETKLNTELQSRRNIAVKKEMREDAHRIVGRVEAVWTGASSKALVPFWLEEGTRPHIIRAVRAGALYFFWPRIGGYAMFKQVHHPGFPGIRYMERSFEEMRAEIVDSITDAVRRGAAEGQG